MAKCLTPISIENPKWVEDRTEDRYIPVPCGRCMECLKTKTSQWSFRIRQEQKVSDSVYFVTLTYDTETVPLSKNKFMTLDKRDFQLFIKRLRKLHDGKPIKYYAVGEYGTQRRRPHYHAIIFNARDTDIVKAWILPEDQKLIGKIEVEPPKAGAVEYCLKYMHKGKWKPLHRNDDRLPEFSLSSKGLGKNYLTESTVTYFKTSLQNYITIDGGVRISMPRYYKDKITPTVLAPTRKNELLVKRHPSILTEYWDNDALRKNQRFLTQDYINSLPLDEREPRDRREAKFAAVNNFNNKALKRKDV